MRPLDVDTLLPRLVDQLNTLISTQSMEFESEEIPCAEDCHGVDKWLHDDGPATMYLQIWHACMHRVGHVEPVCDRMATFFTVNATEDMTCLNCGYSGQAWEFATVYGPIGKM